LLNMARHSTAADLERICRLLRGAQTDPAAARAAEDRRWVRRRATDDGLVKIEALLPADEAELVLKAIDGRVAPGGYLPGLPQIRTCATSASGSSVYGFAELR